MKANAEHVPQPIAAQYYGQRASEGGLLISEATFVAPSAGGEPCLPPSPSEHLLTIHRRHGQCTWNLE